MFAQDTSLSIGHLVNEVQTTLLAGPLVNECETSGLLKVVCDMLLQTATRHRTASDVVNNHTFAVLVRSHVCILGQSWCCYFNMIYIGGSTRLYAKAFIFHLLLAKLLTSSMLLSSCVC